MVDSHVLYIAVLRTHKKQKILSGDNYYHDGSRFKLASMSHHGSMEVACT